MKTAINLLPPVYRRQRLVRRRAIQWSVVLLASLSAIGVAAGYKGREFRTLERQFAAAARAGRPAQNMLREITAMRGKIEKLQQHQSIAQELEQQRQVLTLLGAVSQAARRSKGRLRVVDCQVDDLQATEVAAGVGEGAAHPGTVTLLGVALDSPAVAEFHDSLMRSGLFADVKLIKSQEREHHPELYDYEVRCEL